MRTYATMLRNRPDFFIHSGDTIYSDIPILAEQKMPNGDVWKNLVVEEKSKSAETLAEYRGNYKYNLLDKNLLAFNAEIPTIAQWDDHEVTNNWWPGEPLTRAEHQRRKYVEKNTLALMARGSRAFHEFMPTRATAAEPGRVYRKISYGPLLDVFMLDMRSYRGPNGENLQQTYGPDANFLGPEQIAWLKRELMASRATWKVVANDMPLALIRVYDPDRNWGSGAIGQGDNGAPRGRELEIADLLSFIKRAAIRTSVWITADVHRRAHYFGRTRRRSRFQRSGNSCKPDPPGPQRESDRRHVRAAGCLREGADPGEGSFVAPSDGLVLRPRRHRRRDRGHDGDTQGCRRQHPLVEEA
jgi:alkaline phosphatase D